MAPSSSSRRGSCPRYPASRSPAPAARARERDILYLILYYTVYIPLTAVPGVTHRQTPEQPGGHEALPQERGKLLGRAERVAEEAHDDDPDEEETAGYPGVVVQDAAVVRDVQTPEKRQFLSTENCRFSTEKRKFSTEKCRLSTEKWQLSTEKCRCSTEKCQFGTSRRTGR